MRTLISIFLFATAALGQTKEDFLISKLNFYRTNKINWTTIESRSVNRDEVLNKIFLDSMDLYCKDALNITKYADFDKIYGKKFHFVDIDNDNDLDLIFSGLECLGVEGGNVNIYLNSQNTYKKKLSSIGKIVDINQLGEIVIYKYPCCVMTENSLLLVRFKSDTIQNLSEITFFDLQDRDLIKNAIPKKLKFSTEILVDGNTDLKLAPQDSIIVDIPLSISDQKIGTVVKQTKARIFAVREDKAGQIWYYCKFNNNDVKLVNDRIKSTVTAWIKKK